MEEHNRHQYDDEVSLKELILKGQEYARYLWTKKWWIILAGLIGAGIGFYRAYTTPITYTAELTFMVNEDDGSSIGGVGAILGQFGLGGAGASEYNLDKIVALAKSRRIIHGVLLDSVEVGGKNDLVANHIIRAYSFHDEWEESAVDGLKSFTFHNDSIALFDITDKRVINILYDLMVGSPKTKPKDKLLDISYIDETGILKMISSTTSDELSVRLVNGLYETLSHFYILKSTEKQKGTFTKLTEKVDSVKRELQYVEARLAKIQDRTTAVLQRSSLLNQSRLSRDVQVLTIMYGEILKNRETAGFVLDNATPFFQQIDEPAEPLLPDSRGVVKNTVFLGAIGAFFTIMFFVLKIFIAQMNDE